VLQGLSLPYLIRLLGVEDEGEEEREETGARLRTAEAALEKIGQLEDEEWVREDTAERMRELYEYRRRRFAARHGGYSATVATPKPARKTATRSTLRRISAFGRSCWGPSGRRCSG